MACEFGADGRRLVLADIENFLGRRYMTRSASGWAAVQLRSLLGTCDDELVVVGTSRTSNLLSADSAWRHVRHVARLGEDGADPAPLDVLAENVEERFTEVVLVSGDGIFASAVAALGVGKVRTTVVARAEALSAQLRVAAQRVLCPQVQFFGSTIDGMVA
jgi:hypothetical protein